MTRGDDEMAVGSFSESSPSGRTRAVEPTTFLSERPINVVGETEVVALHHTLQYSTVQNGTVHDSTVQNGTVRYGTVRYGTVRYGTVR